MMNKMSMGEMETRFAKLIWHNAPLPSGKLAKLALEELEWKRTTTYTVLKKLCDKGLFENKDSVIHVLISEEEYRSIRSEQMVKEEYGDSLPSFIAAFTSRKKLSEKEKEEIRKLLEAERI